MNSYKRYIKMIIKIQKESFYFNGIITPDDSFKIIDIL